MKCCVGISSSSMGWSEKLMATKIKYCEKCGNSGYTIDGELCSCQIDIKGFYGSVSRIDIPEAYQGHVFNKNILSKKLPAAYGSFLQEIYDNVTSIRWHRHNVTICSPPGSGKSTLAYSCIEGLFAKGIPVLTLFDVFELKKTMLDFDNGRKLSYDISDPALIMTAPYLFVRVPRVLSFDTYDTVAYLLDKRIRRNGSTFFLFNGTWDEMVALDSHKVVKRLAGDGSYGTLQVSSWESPQGIM